MQPNACLSSVLLCVPDDSVILSGTRARCPSNVRQMLNIRVLKILPHQNQINTNFACQRLIFTNLLHTGFSEKLGPNFSPLFYGINELFK
jgi:hypothetical protein